MNEPSYYCLLGIDERPYVFPESVISLIEVKNTDGEGDITVSLCREVASAHHTNRDCISPIFIRTTARKLEEALAKPRTLDAAMRTMLSAIQDIKFKATARRLASHFAPKA